MAVVDGWLQSLLDPGLLLTERWILNGSTACKIRLLLVAFSLPVAFDANVCDAVDLTICETVNCEAVNGRRNQSLDRCASLDSACSARCASLDSAYSARANPNNFNNFTSR